ncbi:hypothetical protein [Blastopirellula marina]|uniref:Uncharacterized protein n=1 Tax=Blastopirellula marina DSM 3645 TaxID=314230 RepID=A3ZRZ5_9BACT|nr:hypothetical protein [Blastopirellula marina]EAQ80917.1 hypothetical protein DSM3645_12891 [Blastopirellula marina DSM 3645]
MRRTGESTTIYSRTLLIQDSLRLGFFIGAGLGILAGAAFGVYLHENLLCQAIGLGLGGSLGSLNGWRVGLKRARLAAQQVSVG